MAAGPELLRTSAAQAAARPEPVHEDEDGLTTLMICNLPPQMSIMELQKQVEAKGFARTYDLIHIVVGLKTRRGEHQRRNLGYGFINFKHPIFAEAFRYAFNDCMLPGDMSERPIVIRDSLVQGFDDSLMKVGKTVRKREHQGELLLSI